MAFTVLKKICPHCGKSFLTREEDMVYCNTLCEARKKYNEHFGFKEHKKISATCAFCGDEVRSTRSGVKKNANKFCTAQCRKGYAKRQRDIESNSKDKKPHVQGNKLPLEVLNKIEEKKRVFDDKHAYWYTRRGGSYRS